MKIKPVEIKKILYTTDLSDTSLHAFSYAASLANLYNATITILHVMAKNINIEPHLAGILDEAQWEEIRKRHHNELRDALIGKSRQEYVAEDALDQFAKNVKTDSSQLSFEVDEILVINGDPSEKILKVAKDYNFDLIVMGTHGHSLVADILGSTARRVTRRSEIPVLSVRLTE